MKKPATRTLQVAGLVSLCHTVVAMAKQGYKVTGIEANKVALVGHPIDGFHVKLSRVGTKAALAVDPQIVDLDTGYVLGSVKER